jgi:heptose-I-phosphate ethanolaminephosphotransferase
MLITRNQNISKNLQHKICSHDFDNIVIILGESASSDHNPLYGYSDNGQSLLKDQGFVVFKAISPANQTRVSIPLMLTDTDIRDFSQFYKNPSIVTDLRECGYQTYWISNQSRNSQHDDNTTSIANEANMTIFLEDSPPPLESDDPNHHFDGELVEHIAQFSKGHKQAFFVHLAGSHIAYSSRYPETFAPRSGDKRKDYDSTIRYTDTVLRGLFDQFDKGSLLFMYASDHAEVFFDEESGHGFFPAYKDEYRIPLLIWSSDKELLTTLEIETGNRWVNTESFDNIIRRFIGRQEGTKATSYSRTVLTASFKKTSDYDALR